MAKQSHRRCDQLPVLHPAAAAIDLGATELFVAVGADRDAQPVRCFPMFTRDLQALADRLEQCGVRSDAMESTSVYRIPIYLPRQLSAQQERAMTQNGHLRLPVAVGLLRPSFRPPGTICAVIALGASRQSGSDGS
jgi:hypothetical protein